MSSQINNGMTITTKKNTNTQITKTTNKTQMIKNPIKITKINDLHNKKITNTILNTKPHFKQPTKLTEEFNNQYNQQHNQQHSQQHNQIHNQPHNQIHNQTHNRIKLDKQSKSTACIHWIPLNEECYACAKQSSEAFTMREHIPISFQSNLKNQQISKYNQTKNNPETNESLNFYKIHSSTADKLNSVNNRAFVNISGNTQITAINDPQRMAVFDRNKYNDSQTQSNNENSMKQHDRHTNSQSGQAYNGLYVNHNDQPRNVNHMYQPNQYMMESNLNESNLNVNTRIGKNNDSHEDFFLSRSLIADTRHGNRFFEIKPICDKKQNRLNE